jgi:bifunctional non-homologous end joining protein LigD
MRKFDVPKGAVPSGLPAEFRFLLVRSASESPEGNGWLHEIKHDGHRLLAITDGCGSLSLRSRNGFDRTDLFQASFVKLASAGGNSRA